MSTEPHVAREVAGADRLLAKILEDPDDLGARMVYGDALAEAGDPRGELVTAQCTLAAANIHGVDDLVDAEVDITELARLVRIQRRVERLCARYSKQWQAQLELPEATGVRFRRGMPEAIYTNGLVYPAPRPVVPVIEQLARQTPIAELHLMFRSNVEELHRLVPLLGHVHEIDLETVDVTWDTIEQLVAAAPRLRRLQLRQLKLDGAGLARLARLPVMRQLVRLDLDSSGSLGKDAIIGVLAAHPHLIASVARCGFTDADIVKLVEQAPDLRGLYAHGNPLGLKALRALVSLPKLRHLGFDPGTARVDPDEIGRVIARGNAPLRSLQVGTIAWRGMEAIAAAPRLAGLRVLELGAARQRDLRKRGNQAIATLRELVRLRLRSDALHPEVELSNLPLLVQFGRHPAPAARR